MKTISAITTKMVVITCVVSMLYACSGVPSGHYGGYGSYGTAVVNRTIPERIVDEGIERIALKNLPNVVGLEDMSQKSLRIVIDSFRREVLLTGEVPSEQIKSGIAEMIGTMKDVVKVHNHLSITPYAKGQSHTIHENFLKSKINTRIVASRSALPTQYKLVVRNNEVYVLGYLMPTQRTQVLEAIKSTTGMERVVMLTHLVGRDGELLSADDVMTDNVLYADDKGGGVVYGGQPVHTAMPEPTGVKPRELVESSVVKMDKPPQTGYVQLYNGTDNP